MSLLRGLIALLLTSSAQASDWRDTLSSPGKFPLQRPLTATYSFGWSSLPAATATLRFSHPKPDQLGLVAQVRTSGPVRPLFRLDADHRASARTQNLRPSIVRQQEVYSDETLSTTLTFDSSGVSRLRQSNHGPPAKLKRFKFVPLYDLHTALRWLRSQRLKSGDTYRCLVYASADPYLVEVQVGPTESIKVPALAAKAIRLELKLSRLDKQQNPDPYQKLRRASVWISDDRDRVLMQAEVEIFVGKVKAELETLTFGP